MADPVEIKRVALLQSDLPKIIMSGPLSLRTTFTLHVAGPVSAREMKNLIRILELQVEWLGDDAEPTTLGIVQ